MKIKIKKTEQIISSFIIDPDDFYGYEKLKLKDVIKYIILYLED